MGEVSGCPRFRVAGWVWRTGIHPGRVAIAPRRLTNRQLLGAPLQIQPPIRSISACGSLVPVFGIWVPEQSDTPISLLMT